MAFRPACSEMGFALHSGPLSSRSTTQRHRAHPASSSLTVLPVLLKQCMYWDSPSGLRSTLFGLKLIIAACCWAVSAVISRSFAVEQLRAMVPLADIFNHKPASEASRALDNESGPAVAWSLSEDGERFEVRAREDVAPGKEVRICYGEESAAEILAVHGMILSENEADYLEIFESGEDLLAAVETLSGHPRGDRAKLMEASLSPDDVLLRPTLEASEPLLRALEVSLCEDEELPDVPGAAADTEWGELGTSESASGIANGNFSWGAAGAPERLALAGLTFSDPDLARSFTSDEGRSRDFPWRRWPATVGSQVPRPHQRYVGQSYFIRRS
eukprot:s212_g30.t1